MTSLLSPPLQGAPVEHRLEDVIALFDGLFSESFQTRLERGGDEPLYLPADEQTPWHRVIFARGFFASVLHEVSHWCIAGARRRQLEDYGYWYEPDGRDQHQQQAFEQVEVAPQALESLFCRAAGLSFHVSVDNLGEVEVDREAFSRRVAARAEGYCRDGLPLRAAAFEAALKAFYLEGRGLAEAIRCGRKRLVPEPVIS
ncbi:elongation factor P hydroxylase [Halomonas denitrificans]|nr:elongation factor P hydroxylase [Halomonas sp. DP8Y7-3]MBY6027741.1 elongation factor P hydroxylase [Halomonas sp. DP8Y7-1]MCA0972864.1 elongation factor P hydroxylase [Halomonas denitrificans]